MAVRVALLPGVEFGLIIQSLSVHKQFWNCLAIKLVGQMAPVNQNPLKYLQDVYLLSAEHIKLPLFKELQAYSVDPEIDDNLRMDLRKLLSFYSRYIHPEE